jgi:hypothetical protein
MTLGRGSAKRALKLYWLTRKDGWRLIQSLAALRRTRRLPTQCRMRSVDCFKRAGEARITYLQNYGAAATPVQLAPQLPLIRITKDRWWCPYFQRYYPEAQTCPTGSWEKVTQELDCRDATDADDVARCRLLSKQQAVQAREEIQRKKAEAATVEAPENKNQEEGHVMNEDERRGAAICLAQVRAYTTCYGIARDRAYPEIMKLNNNIGDSFQRRLDWQTNRLDLGPEEWAKRQCYELEDPMRTICAAAGLHVPDIPPGR